TRGGPPSSTRPRFVGAALDSFGRDRLMFGGDWPVSSMSMTYAEVVDAVEDSLDRVPGATEDDRRAVWGATAVERYCLPD
ncbi:amidohydrolase family protein, partial [Streptomyces griseoincarnatus]